VSGASSSGADPWVTSLQALMRAMLPVQPPGASSAPGAADAQGLLQEQFADLRDTWQESIEKWTELVRQGPTAAPVTAEALRELFAPARWNGAGSFDAGLQQVLEGPKYALLSDLDRQLLALQQLALRRDTDVAAFHAILLKAWGTAFERFASGVPAQTARQPTSWRAMADRWIGVVNDTLIEVQRSEAFVEAQRKMLRSASDHRLQEQTMAEAWCQAFHVPTRTEMDEVQRTLTELRRQLRALQRAIGPKPVASPAPALQPPKRAAAKKSRASVRR
jgi:hypothetical protein